MVELQPVDAVEVMIVVDNVVDMLLPGGEGVRRLRFPADLGAAPPVLAEQGFSALVTVVRDGARSSVLYDGGMSATALSANLDALEVPVRDLRALVMSHGHVDHHGGLEGLFRRYGRPGLPLLIHPDAWRERRIALPSGAEIRMAPPSAADLSREGVETIEERDPTLLLDGTLLVSGQIERSTAFEQGLPGHEALLDGDWKPDPLIFDDQCVIANVRGRGLVVVSGCSHAGAINVLRNAIRLTGETRVAGFVGGMHLAGPAVKIIEPTLAELRALAVERIVPAHCTGWRAIHRIAASMPDAFVQPSVGTTLVF